MKTLAEIFFPHEEALRAIFADQPPKSAQEALQAILANQGKLTRDQQRILRKEIGLIESPRLPASVGGQLLLFDLAHPYARESKAQAIGAAMGGPEADRYAQSYVPLTMDARDYLWGDASMDAINQGRKEELAGLEDNEIEQIMKDHREMVEVLYAHPEIAQYYPCVPSADDQKKIYPLERALQEVDTRHRQLWSAIAELRQRRGVKR